MKNKILNYIIIVLILYISTSFIFLDINPSKWDEGARFGFVMMSFIACGVYFSNSNNI